MLFPGFCVALAAVMVLSTCTDAWAPTPPPHVSSLPLGSFSSQTARQHAPHDQQAQLTRLRFSSSSTSTANLSAEHNSEWGHFYFNISMGGAVVQVIPDTGSTDLAIPLHGCQLQTSDGYTLGACPDPLFNSPQSVNILSCTTLKSPPCLNGLEASTLCLEILRLVPGTQAYSSCETSEAARYDIASWAAECSRSYNVSGVYPGACAVSQYYGIGKHSTGWRAVVASTTIDITMQNTGNVVPTARFAGIATMIGDNFGEDSMVPEGVLGLAFASLSRLGSKNAVEQTFSALGLEPVVSMCFGVGEGRISLGGVDTSLYSGELVWLPLLQTAGGEYSYYLVEMDQISLQSSSGDSTYGTISLTTDSDGGIQSTAVDTGAPTTVLSSTAFQELSSLFQSSNLCDLTTSTLTQTTINCVPVGPVTDVPRLFFRIRTDSGDLAMIEFTQYIEVTGGHWLVTLRTSSELAFNVIGVSMLQGWYSVFDMNNKRVGIAPRATTGEPCPTIDATVYFPATATTIPIQRETTGWWVWLLAVVFILAIIGIVVMALVFRFRFRKHGFHQMGRSEQQMVATRHMHGGAGAARTFTSTYGSLSETHSVSQPGQVVML